MYMAHVIIAFHILLKRLKYASFFKFLKSQCFILTLVLKVKVGKFSFNPYNPKIPLYVNVFWNSAPNIWHLLEIG